MHAAQQLHRHFSLAFSFDKGWINGSIDTVSSDFKGENITLDGGNLTVHLDDKPKEDNKSGGFTVQGKVIQVKNMDVQVQHTGHHITLKGVHTIDNKVCFSSGKLEFPNITSGDGCYNKETHSFSLGWAEMKELKIMGATVKNLTAENITYNTKSKTATVGKVTNQITFESQTFHVESGNLTASRKPDKITIESLKVKHPWLASDTLDIGKITVEHGEVWNLTLGDSNIKIEPKTLTISGEEDCNTWISSLPSNLKIGPLSTVKMSGKTSFSIGFKPKPTFNLKSDCRAKCDSIPNLRKPFKYTAYNPKGKTFDRITGIGSKEWIPLRMTGDMPLAVVNLEDPGFEHHRGYITQAFTNSFLDNLKQGKFLRGGSTITMQLAKNIWLSREKTIGRKVQELFLSQALESCYSKDEILELYLNVVEFGPNQYGIGNGSMHWFHKGPGELDPVESFWLASILPKPSRTPPPDKQSLDRISSLMKKLSTDGRIPDYLLEVEEEETSAHEDR